MKKLVFVFLLTLPLLTFSQDRMSLKMADSVFTAIEEYVELGIRSPDSAFRKAKAQAWGAKATYFSKAFKILEKYKAKKKGVEFKNKAWKKVDEYLASISGKRNPRDKDMVASAKGGGSKAKSMSFGKRRRIIGRYGKRYYKVQAIAGNGRKKNNKRKRMAGSILQGRRK